jgi:aryl-alcohol dehydrogenase-like predicted oxidoreductase
MDSDMHDRKLGPEGPNVFPLGLGCMNIGMGDVYTSSAHSDHDAVVLIRRALDLGVTLIDTADLYGTSERQVGKALSGYRQRVTLATKFGFLMTASSRTPGETHALVWSTAARTTYGGHATVRRAQKVHPVAAVQTEYSLFSRDPEQELLQVLRDAGIALVASSPLGRGFLAGRFHEPADLAAADLRRRYPRFQAENFAKNLRLIDRLRELALRKGCTTAQLALAWLLVRHQNVIPIPGTTSVQRLEENMAAVNVELSESELAQIEEIVPRGAVAGARYDPTMTRLLDG